MTTATDERIKIGIGCDHAGFPYKNAIIAFLELQNFEVVDFGTHSLASVDYPDFSHPVAKGIERGELSLGILLCGSGNGVAMAANKHAHIRAALCWLPELALMARTHNDANILALPVRFVSEALALQMVEIFVNTAFEGGRHTRRVEKIER